MSTLNANKLSVAGVRELISMPASGSNTFSYTQGTTFWDLDDHAGTISFTNVPVTDQIVTFTILAPTGVVSAPTTVNVNGTTVAVRWSGGSAPTKSVGKFDVWTFSIVSKLPNLSGITLTVLGAKASFG